MRTSSLTRVAQSHGMMKEELLPEIQRKAYTPQMRRKSCVPALSQTYHDPRLAPKSSSASSDQCPIFPVANKSRLVQRRMSVQPVSSFSQVKVQTRRSISASGQSVHFAEPGLRFGGDGLQEHQEYQAQGLIPNQVRENPDVYYESVNQVRFANQSDRRESQEGVRSRRYSEGATPSHREINTGVQNGSQQDEITYSESSDRREDKPHETGTKQLA